ncbi:GDSL-type esterase/lipase family protein [Nonomuraea sp. NPDC050404]|uniref:GDSL-type esterase/lipase family protein n=1 Tax=Nonomuraea sp. NPDC050404 TaxID=3155783 RepID=UPI0033D0BE8D
MNTRRTTGRAALIVSIVVTLLLGLTPPVTAMAAPPPALSSGLLSVVPAKDSVTLELELGSYDKEQVSRLLHETQSRNPRISDTARQDFEDNPHTMPGGGAGFDNWVDFNGRLSTTTTGIAITVETGELGTNANLWQNLLATAAGVLMTIALRAICLGFAPEAAVVCVSVGAFFGSMTRTTILQAIDGQLKDPKAWATSLANALALAAGGAAWEAGIGAWARNTLPGHIRRLGEALVELGRKLGSWWNNFKGYCRTAGEFVREVGAQLGDAVSRIHLMREVRVMPLGDSITYGVQSSDGNGYRDEMHAYLKSIAIGGKVDFVGSVKSGSMGDRDNEGHPGRRIDEIATIAECMVPRYKPSLIFLHAGTNDMNQNHELSSAPARLKELISRALRSTRATVLVAKLIPTDKPGLQPRIDAFNAALPGMVKDLQAEGKQVLLVDMKRVLVRDGLQNDAHPTDTGYAKMAGAWAGAVQEAHERGWIPTPVPEGEPSACNPADSDDTNPSLGGDGATALGEGWRKLGVIAPGYGHNVGRTIIAELNGDKRADYLQVRDDGSIRASMNTVGSPGFPDWVDLGVYDPGDNPGNGGQKIDVDPDTVRFADINGDGRDDYLVVSDDSKVRAYLNFAAPGDRLNFVYHGIVFDPEPFNRANLRFADVTGEGRDDILRVSAEGAAHVYENRWDPAESPGNGNVGRAFWKLRLDWAGGTKGSSLQAVRFADGDGDGRADYLQVSVEGAVHAFMNRGGGGNGSFERRYDWAHASNYPREYVQFADISGDGRADYLVVYHGGAVRAWLNRGGNR